jgi:mannose-6-phosphate isomerase-like protein (cupin superfamily)
VSGLGCGRLAGAADAPADGERHEVLARPGAARVEQILTGRLAGPQPFVGEQDEWVVVLAGSAVLEAAGAAHAVEAGDWLLIPAGEPHVLVEAAPGTVWLAVHAPPAAREAQAGAPRGASSGTEASSRTPATSQSAE